MTADGPAAPTAGDWTPDHGASAAGDWTPDHGASAAGDWTPDHGASAERTRLAWRRTMLSAGAVALLCVRPALAPRPGATTVLVTAAAMAGWAVLTGLAYRRARGLAARPPWPGRRTIVACSSITLGFALLGGLVVLR